MNPTHLSRRSFVAATAALLTPPTFAESGPPALDLTKKFQWTSDDQNAVSEMIANQNMSPDDAAKKWVEANPDKVAAWLS